MRGTKRLIPISVFAIASLFAAGSTFAQQPLVTITTPSGGAFLTEGQTYTITVSSDPLVQNIGIGAEFPVAYAQPTANPNQFTLTLPMNIPPGTYHLTAAGSNASGAVTSAPAVRAASSTTSLVALSAKSRVPDYCFVHRHLPSLHAFGR
jgi:hypothetical protein